MIAAIKGRAATGGVRTWRRIRMTPMPVACMALAVPVFAFFSAQSFFVARGTIRGLLGFDPWIPIGIWGGALLLAMIRPLNVGIVSILGGRPPSPEEDDYLIPLWQELIRQTGVRSNRYDLRVTAHRRIPADRDLGPYVVTIDKEEIRRLPPGELSALLAQRLSRQTILLGPALGLCLWALLPLALWLGLTILMLIILRGVYRAMFGAVKEAGPPPGEFAAGCVLTAIAVGIAAFIAFVAVGAFAIEFLIEAAVGAMVVTALARWAEKRADIATLQLGYGPALVTALKRLDSAQIQASGWRNLLNTTVPPNERATLIGHELSTTDK
jgi:hypothetical protein